MRNSQARVARQARRPTRARTHASMHARRHAGKHMHASTHLCSCRAWRLGKRQLCTSWASSRRALHGHSVRVAAQRMTVVTRRRGCACGRCVREALHSAGAAATRAARCVASLHEAAWRQQRAGAAGSRRALRVRMPAPRGPRCCRAAPARACACVCPPLHQCWAPVPCGAVQRGPHAAAARVRAPERAQLQGFSHAHSARAPRSGATLAGAPRAGTRPAPRAGTARVYARTGLVRRVCGRPAIRDGPKQRENTLLRKVLGRARAYTSCAALADVARRARMCKGVVVGKPVAFVVGLFCSRPRRPRGAAPPAGDRKYCCAATRPPRAVWRTRQLPRAPWMPSLRQREA